MSKWDEIKAARSKVATIRDNIVYETAAGPLTRALKGLEVKTITLRCTKTEAQSNWGNNTFEAEFRSNTEYPNEQPLDVPDALPIAATTFQLVLKNNERDLTKDFEVGRLYKFNVEKIAEPEDFAL